MADSEYRDNYKSLKISIGWIIKNPEMLRFVLEYLKTKKMCKHVVKTFLFVIRYASDRYKTQEICDKAILENGGTL